jgi:hypothetical protein
VAEAIGEAEVTGCTAGDIGDRTVGETAGEPVGNVDRIVSFGVA